MYLVVFVFLMISILGLYTQVYALQAARMFSGQKSVAETMLLWNNVASRVASTNPATDLKTTGCYMTPGALLAPCTVRVQASDFGNVGTASNIYDWRYQWQTIYFQGDDGQKIVLTYVAPDATGMAVAPAIGYTTYEIYRQIQNLGLSKQVYGWVSSTTPVTVTVGGGFLRDVTTGVQTPIKPTVIKIPAFIPPKSVAILSFL